MIEATAVEPMTGPADLDAILAIEEATFNNPTTRAWYEAELARPEVCKVFVIRTAETSVAGFAAFWKVVDEMHINNLAVHPTCGGRRRNGGPPGHTGSATLEPARAATIRGGWLPGGGHPRGLLRPAGRGRARAEYGS